MFFYWGWDVTANLSEETVNRKRAPGLSGLLGMIVSLTLFLTTVVGVQLLLPVRAIAESGIVVIVSAIGSLETTLVSGSRIVYSMGRDGGLDERFGTLGKRFFTPWNATIAIGLVSLALFASAATSTSVNAILSESINAIGVEVAIFYGLSAIACATFYAGADRGRSPPRLSCLPLRPVKSRRPVCAPTSASSAYSWPAPCPWSFTGSAATATFIAIQWNGQLNSPESGKEN